MCDYGVERSAVLGDNLTMRNGVEMGVVACNYGAERMEVRRTIMVRNGMGSVASEATDNFTPVACSRNVCSYLRPVLSKS